MKTCGWVGCAALVSLVAGCKDTNTGSRPDEPAEKAIAAPSKKPGSFAGVAEQLDKIKQETSENLTEAALKAGAAKAGAVDVSAVPVDVKAEDELLTGASSSLKGCTYNFVELECYFVATLKEDLERGDQYKWGAPRCVDADGVTVNQLLWSAKGKKGETVRVSINWNPDTSKCFGTAGAKIVTSFEKAVEKEPERPAAQPSGGKANTVCLSKCLADMTRCAGRCSDSDQSCGADCLADHVECQSKC